MRLNQANQFSNGTYTPYVLRTDGGFESYGSTRLRNNYSSGATIILDLDNASHYGLIDFRENNSHKGFFGLGGTSQSFGTYAAYTADGFSWNHDGAGKMIISNRGASRRIDLNTGTEGNSNFTTIRMTNQDVWITPDSVNGNLRSPLYYISNDTTYLWNSDRIVVNQVTFPYREWDYGWGSHGVGSGTQPLSFRMWDSYTQGGAPSSYGTLIEYYGLSGHQHDQYYFYQGEILHRYGWYGNNNWQSGWRAMLHAGNYSSYAIPVSGGINMTGSYGLNDNRLYLRTNGDTNHFLWNADDDWEELRYYTGTGFRIQGSTGTTSATFTNGGINAVNMTIGGSQVWYNSGGWLGDLASYGFTRAWGLAMAGGSEFVLLYKSGQGYVLVDGSYYAYEAGGFYSSNNSAGNTLLGFYADGTSSVRFNSALRIGVNNNIYLDYNYGQSIVGVYTSTRYQGVFSMGDSYKLAIDGSSPGGLYGLAWSHPNAGGQASYLNDHGLLVMNYGTTFAAISSRIWARDQMNAPIYYDRNTGYYIDGDGISNLAVLRVTAASSGYSAMFGPYTLSTNGVTMVLADDNRYSVQVNAPYYPHLGISAYSNSGNTTHGACFSLTGYKTAGGYRRFVMGVANQNPDELSFGWFDNADNPHYGVGINWSYPASVWYDTGHNWHARGSMRAPIFYDRDNTGRYIDQTGQSYIYNLCVGENNYSHAYPGVLQVGSTSYNYNFLNGSWAGAITTGILANCADEWEFAIHDSGTRVASAFIFQSGPNRFLMGRGLYWGTSYVEAAESSRAPIFYDSNDTSYYTNPNGFSQMSSANFNNYIDFARLRPIGVGGNSGQGTNPYDIFQEGGGWGYPYPDLRIAYHTGIKLGANAGSYEGVRLYSDYDMSGILIQLSGSSNYSFWHTWQRLEGYHGIYSGINSAHIYPNNSTYGQWRIDGSRNGYGGILIDVGNTPVLMFDGGGNGGIYYQSGRWLMYHYFPYNCVGINTSSTSPSYGMYVYRGIYATENIVAYSDRRAKENIQTIDSALDKVLQLRGVYYNRIDDVDKKRQVGVIAQEVEEILPEVVTYCDVNDEYGVAYGNLSGILIEAVKEQNRIIEKQSEEIKELKEILNNLILNIKG